MTKNEGVVGGIVRHVIKQNGVPRHDSRHESVKAIQRRKMAVSCGF